METGTTFLEGDTVWLSDGRKAEFVAKASHGIIVRLGFCRPGDDDDSGSEYFDAVEIVADVFASPPLAVIENRVTALLEKEAAARERLAAITRDISASEKQNADRLKRLSKYPPLDMIEAIVEGKVTHFIVVPPYSELGEIETFEEATTRIDREYGREKKDLRMLALVGKGDLLTWKINDYYDGGGSWRATVHPFLSYDAALVKLTEICQMAAAALPRDKVDSRHISVVERAKKYGIDVPQWIHDAVAALRAEARQKKIAKAEAELAAARATDDPQV